MPIRIEDIESIGGNGGGTTNNYDELLKALRRDLAKNRVYGYTEDEVRRMLGTKNYKHKGAWGHTLDRCKIELKKKGFILKGAIARKTKLKGGKTLYGIYFSKVLSNKELDKYIKDKIKG